MTNAFTTVFEVSLTSGPFVEGTLSRVALGIGALCLGIWLSPRDRGASVLVVLLSVAWLAGNGVVWWFRTQSLRPYFDAYRSGRADVAEGPVHIVHYQDRHGHGSTEKISVGGREFVLNFFETRPGYNQPVWKGGVLREGVYARLHHYNDAILKVEIRAPPGAK